MLLFARFLLVSFFVLFTLSCSSDPTSLENGLRAKTSGELGYNKDVFIEFEDKILIDEDRKNFLDVKINGDSKEVEARYEGNTVFISNEFKPNSQINMKLNIAKKDIQLNFKTPKLSYKILNTDFIPTDKKGFVAFSITLSKSSNLDFDYVNGISLYLDGKVFKIIKKIGTKERIKLISQEIELTDEARTVEVKFLSKHLGSDKDETLTYTTPYNKTDLQIINSSTSERLISIDFSATLDEKQNLKDFVSISPAIDFRAVSVGNQLRLSANFDRTLKYTVSIMQGLSSKDGLKTSKKLEQSISFSDLEPGLSFANSGVFLPSSADRKIAFKSRNIRKVKLTVHQIYTNNLSEYLRYKNFEKGIDTSSDSVLNTHYDEYADNNFEYVSSKILEKEFDIDFKKNEWVLNEIKLDGLKDLSGVFAVSLESDEDSIEYEFDEDYKKYRFLENSKISKNIIFSNMAIIAQAINDKIYINVRDYTSKDALANVKISVVDKQNQILAQANTDSNGDVVVSTNTDKALLVIASNEKEASVLRLSDPVNLDGFDVAGIQNPGSLKAFIYTDRGVYRPGDNIHLTVVALNENEHLKHPIILSLSDSKSVKILDDVKINPSSDYMFYHEIKLDSNAPTGIYKAQFKIGSSEFYKDILVHTVAPNRLKVNFSNIYMQDDNLNYDLNSTYLFGAPSTNLKFKTSVRFSVNNFTNSKYKDYIFSDKSILLYSYLDNHTSNLNENGFANSSFSLPTYIKNALGTNFKASLSAEVFESGGQSTVAVADDVDIIKTNFFVGLKKLKNSYVKSGTKLDFQAIVSGLDENLIADRKLLYKIYKVDYSWWWDYDNFESFLRSSKRDSSSTLVDEGYVKSGKNPVNISFDTGANYGNMYILVYDEEKPNVRAMQSFYVSSFGEPSKADIVSSLQMKSDKKEYSVNDTALIEFESVKDAKALITVSNDRDILQNFVLDTKDKSTSFELKLDKTYAPNVYVSVNLIQNYNSLENDKALKLFGVIPIMVNDSSTKLDLSLKTPEKILPNTDFEIEISSKQKKEYAYTVAIVDEGLLSLTDFKSPDIWGYFYAKTGFKLKVFDTYDKIISKLDEKVSAVFSTGGDKELRVDKNKDDEAQRFKPVVLFNAPAKSDKNGYAKLKFKMPSYMGEVRVMVVASAKDSFGSVSKNVKVSAPVVLLETVPRVLRMGDEFKLLSQIFKTEDGVKNASLSLRSKNKLIDFERSSIKVDFDNAQNKDVVFNAKVKDDLVGKDEIEFELRSGSYTYKNSIEIDIKPLNAYTYERKSYALKAGEKMDFIIDDSFVRSDVKATIKLSSSPIINLESRLKYLLSYPYGCIEQTTSAVLPQLYIDRFSKKAPKQKAINNINAALERYTKFQTADGGFAYWQGGKSSHLFGSAYAGMFLLLAKDAGYNVNENMLKRWISYQKNFVSSNTSNLDNNALYHINLQAYSLYLLALAKEPNISAMNMLYEKRKDLSTESQWLLAAAYKLAGIDDIALKIASSISVNKDSDDIFNRYSFGSTTRQNAMIAEAYRQIYGKNNENLVKALSDSLNSNNYLSTQSAGYALFALAKAYDLSKEAKNANMDALLKINEQNIRLDSSDELSFEFEKGKASVDTNNPMFVDFSVEGVKKEIAKPYKNNLEVKREFYDEFGNLLSTNEFTSSDTIFLKLTVSMNSNVSSSLSNVALVQLLPSGFEVANELLAKNTSKIKSSNPQNTNFLDFVDIRDDKIMWFFNIYRANQPYSLYIKLNAVSPGKFTMPGAYVEAMYDNNFQALGEAQSIIVNER